MARTTPVNDGYSIINGSVTGSNGSKIDTWIEWKVTGTSVPNNTSTVRMILYAQATTSLSTNYDSTENYGWVGYDNGNKNWMSKSGYDFRNKALITFGDHTFTIAHNSDGTKTLTIQGGWSTNGHSSYIKDGSVSGQVTLPRIARASTISSLSTNLGSAGTISITRQSSDFTHTLTYSFGSASGTIATKTTSTSVSWTPDVSLIAQFGANDKTKTGTITCTTYSGNTSVGTSTSTLTLTIPNSSLGNVSGTFGSALTLTASNACSSGLTYTFAYNNGSSWQSIASTSSKTQSWTPNTSLIANVSNASSGSVSVRVITYRGSTVINTATATATLTIPKNTSSAVSGTIGSALSIPITKSYSGLTSTITYSFGSASGTIATTTSSTSQSWTPPTNLLTQIPNSTSGTGSITITTYNGTASCGSNSYALTLSAANSVVPTSSLTLTRVNNNSTVNGWGIYLQGYSQVRATLTGNGVNGSTIKSMSIGGTGLSSSSSPSTTSATLTGTSSVLQTSGTLNYKGNVSDSRNRSATEKSQSISVIAYSQPSVSGVSLARSNSSGTLDTSGTYLKVAFTLNYSSASGHNSASVSLRYKETSASSWTTYGTVTNGANLNLNLDVSKNYQAQLLASDSLNSNIASATFTIPSAERVLNVNGSGSGLAIGGFSTDAGKLQVYYPADFEGNTLPTINTLPFVAEAKGFALYGGTEIPNNSDLNDDTFIGAGTWYCNANADAQTLSNCPTNYGFRMIVMKTLRPATPSGSGFNWNMALQTIYDYWGNIYTRYIGYMDDATTKRVGDWQIQTYNYATITETNPTSASAQIAYNLIPDNSVGVVALRRSGATEWVCLVQRNSQYWGSVLMTGQANEGTKKFLLQNGSWKPERWFAEEFYNDTGGSTWQEMVKNKIDYVKSNYPTGHVYILAGGWSGQERGYSFVNYPNSTHISIDFYGIAGVKKYHGYWDGTNYSYKNLTVGELIEVTGTSKTYTASGSDNAVASITLPQGMWLVSTYVKCTGTAANSKFELYYSNFQSDHRSGGWQVSANSPLFMQHHNEVNVGESGYTLNVGVYHSGACTIDAIYIKATSIGNN